MAMLEQGASDANRRFYSSRARRDKWPSVGSGRRRDDRQRRRVRVTTPEGVEHRLEARLGEAVDEAVLNALLAAEDVPTA
jgi:hypothetical protein